MAVYAGETVTIGRFRCWPDDTRWHEVNSVGAGHHVVFPETAVAIEQLGRPAFVTNRNHVVFYNPEQEYRRALVASDGDHCSYLIVDAEEVARMVWQASGGAAGDGRFPLAEAATSDARFLAHRRMLDRALRTASSADEDPLAVEEAALRCAAGVLDDALGAGPAGVQPPPTDRQRRAVERVKELLSLRFAERLTLADIGRAVELSPYHLARVFRRVTGSSLHRYRTGLRVRTAVDRIRRGADDLAAVAVDVGFASHSHLTDSFRQVLGTTPTAIRRDALSSRN